MKFDFKELVNNVKALVNPITIPQDASQDYLVGELGKAIQALVELNTQQATILANITNLLVSLHQQDKK